MNILGILAEHAQLASNEPVRNPRVELLKTVISHIRQNYQHPLSLGELATLAGMNEQYFVVFQKITRQNTRFLYQRLPYPPCGNIAAYDRTAGHGGLSGKRVQ